MCVCVYLETAWFLHFICGRSITTLVFPSFAPSQGKPEYRQLLLFVFNCVLHAGKLGLQNNSSYSVWGGGNRVRSWLIPSVVWSIRSLVGSLSWAGRQQLKMAINHYCFVQNSVDFKRVGFFWGDRGGLGFVGFFPHLCAASSHPSNVFFGWRQEVKAATPPAALGQGGLEVGNRLDSSFPWLSPESSVGNTIPRDGIGEVLGEKRWGFLVSVWMLGGWVWSVFPLGKGEPQCLTLRPRARSGTDGGRALGPRSARVPRGWQSWQCPACVSLCICVSYSCTDKTKNTSSPSALLYFFFNSLVKSRLLPALSVSLPFR